MEDALRLAPILVACAFGMLIMLVDPFLAPAQRHVMGKLGVFGALASLCSVFVSARHLGQSFSGLPYTSLILVDDLSIFMFFSVFTFAFLAMLGSLDYLEREGLQHGEYYALVLFATAGMAVMACAQELLTAFVGLEVSSIASYILAGYRRNAPRSNESALKYFLLGSFATAFFLYGAALIFGGAGSTQLEAIRDAIAYHRSTEPTLLVLGSALVLVGLSFKVATAPFQFWTPDVYEGAPTPVTAFFAAAPKVAGIAMFVRVAVAAFPGITGQWQEIVAFVSIASMLLGSFAAIGQRNIKRLMAYSSIGHMGFALIGLAAGTSEGVQGVLVYMAIYLTMTLGVFAVILSMRRSGGMVESIDQLAGLARTSPTMAFFLAMLLFSMAGVPPLAGFFAKFYVFLAAIKAGLYLLSVIGVLASVIGAYYYLAIVKLMYFDEPAEGFAGMPYELKVVLAVCGLFNILFFLYPGPLVGVASAAAHSLF